MTRDLQTCPKLGAESHAGWVGGITTPPPPRVRRLGPGGGLNLPAAFDLARALVHPNSSGRPTDALRGKGPPHAVRWVPVRSLLALVPVANKSVGQARPDLAPGQGEAR